MRTRTLVALCLLAGCAVEDADPDAGSIAFAPGTTLVRKGSDKCLDVNAAASANGTKIQQWTCNGSGAQAFTLEDSGGGTYRLRNVNSGKCLDIKNGGTSNGTKVQLYTCGSTARQKWKVQDAGGGYSTLVNPSSNRCLDVNGGGNADGTQVQIWSCNGSTAQAWKIGGAEPPPDDDDLVWRQANLTNFTSYPEPGSEECEDFNGCMWAGYFAFVDGQMSESWVMQHDIAAVHERDADEYGLKTLRLRQGSHQLDVKVYDMCSDSDCDGCCTQNASQTGFLIDLESYTADRFGSGDGIVEWTCLDCE
jgi:hypothetical protein